MTSCQVSWPWKYPHVVKATAAAAVTRFCCLNWTKTQQQYMLPDGSQNMENLVLRGCTTIPSTITFLTHLIKLEISNCPDLVEIPKSIGDLHSLEVLRIVGCNQLRDIPSCVLELEQLRKLIVDYSLCSALSRVSTISKEDGSNSSNDAECCHRGPIGGQGEEEDYCDDRGRKKLLPKLESFEVAPWHRVESAFPYELFCGGHPNIEESLQELVLSDCDQFFRIVIMCVDRLTNLKQFRVSYLSSRWKQGCSYQRPYKINNNNVEYTYKVAAAKLKTLSKLETLALEGVAEPEFLYHLFSYPWGGSAVIREIDLTDCNLGVAGCWKIVPGLPPSLAHLALTGNTSLERFLLAVVDHKKSSFPRGMQSLSLGRHPILDPDMLSDGSLLRQRQIVEELIETYPLLGRISCPFGPLMTPELRYKMWSNRCGLHVLTHSSRLNPPSPTPLSVLPIVLERINRIYATDIQSEYAKFQEEQLFTRSSQSIKDNSINDRIRIIQQNRIQVLYTFLLQDFPIWMTS